MGASEPVPNPFACVVAAVEPGAVPKGLRWTLEETAFARGAERDRLTHRPHARASMFLFHTERGYLAVERVYSEECCTPQALPLQQVIGPSPIGLTDHPPEDSPARPTRDETTNSDDHPPPPSNALRSHQPFPSKIPSVASMSTLSRTLGNLRKVGIKVRPSVVHLQLRSNPSIY